MKTLTGSTDVSSSGFADGIVRAITDYKNGDKNEKSSKKAI